MSVKVETVSECEKCGLIHRRDGAEGSVPPFDWAEVTLTYRLGGQGWTKNRRIYKILCPECAGKIESLLLENIKEE